MTLPNREPTWPSSEAEHPNDTRLALEQVTGLAETFDRHLLDLSRRESSKLSPRNLKFIEGTAQSTTQVIYEAVGRHNVSLPGFDNWEDARILNNIVTSGAKLAQFAPVDIEFSIKAEKLQRQKSEWIRLGAIVAHNSYAFDLKNTPVLLTPLEDYALAMTSAWQRFAMANNGLPIDKATLEKFKETALLID